LHRNVVAESNWRRRQGDSQNDTYRLERDWSDWRLIPSPPQSNFENPAVTYFTAVLLMRVYKLYGFFEILPGVLSLEFDVVEAC